MIQVSEHIYRLFAGWTANQYLIVEPGGAALVDTGLPGSHRLILFTLRQLGYQPGDLKYIFLTHADPDHSGAALELSRRTGARLVASQVEAAGLRTGQMTRRLSSTTLEGRMFNLLLPLFPMAGIEVDEIVEPGQEFPVLGGLQVISSPGHTPGHISFYAPQYRTLFAGDSIQVRGSLLSAYQGDSTGDKLTAWRSFEEQMALKPEIICGGHNFYRAQPV